MRANQRLQQRIARQPVRAVQPGTGRFADGEQPGDVRPAVHIRHHAAALLPSVSDLPFTAAAPAANIVTATCRHKGTIGNTVRIALDEDMALPSGITCVIAAGVTGATDTAMSDTLTAMGFGYLFDLAGRGMLSPGQTQLNAKNTPLTPEEAAQALSAGYQSVMSEAPTPEILALLLAQSGHETADWQKIPNYAFGGIKASSGNKYVQAFVTPEGNPSKLYVLAFAAYPTAAGGAEAYIRTLKSRSNWWNGLQTGTPEGLVAGLTVQPYAYFTGSAAQYLASVQRRFAQYTDLAKVSV